MARKTVIEKRNCKKINVDIFQLEIDVLNIIILVTIMKSVVLKVIPLREILEAVITLAMGDMGRVRDYWTREAKNLEKKTF